MTAMTEISKEYGTALFMLACEEKAQRAYAEALAIVKETFLANPSYEEMLSSPSIPLGERLLAIEAAFGEAVPTHVLSYVKLLCEKGRVSCLMESIEAYAALLAASERVFEAHVTSAVTLTEEEKEKLIDRLEKKYKGRVRAEYTVDASLLGGLIVEVDGKVFDGSLRHRLGEVKEYLNE